MDNQSLSVYKTYGTSFLNSITCEKKKMQVFKSIKELPYNTKVCLYAEKYEKILPVLKRQRADIEIVCLLGSKGFEYEGIPGIKFEYFLKMSDFIKEVIGCHSVLFLNLKEDILKAIEDCGFDCYLIEKLENGENI